MPELGSLETPARFYKTNAEIETKLPTSPTSYGKL